MKTKEPFLLPLFAIPVVLVNMNRKFTKDESQLLRSDDIPMWKDEKEGMTNHRSEDLYLFDNFKR